MNIMTNSMNKMHKMLSQADAKLKAYGAEPYGTRKATAKEKQERYDNLTPQELQAMIDERGVDEVNAWLQKFYKEGDNG